MANKPSSQVLKEFLGEAEEILENLNSDLMELAETVDSDGSSPDLLNSIFRAAHSLKGLSGMFGFADVQDLAHHMETLLDGLRLGKVSLNDDVISVLFEALETLAALVNGKAENADFTLDVSPLVARLAQIMGGGGANTETDPLELIEIEAAILDVLTEYEEHRLRENIRKERNLFLVHAVFSLMTFDQDLARVTETLKSDGEVVSTLPSSDSEDPEAIAFQILVGTPLSEKDLAALLDQEQATIRRVQRKGVAPAVPSVPAARSAASAPNVQQEDGKEAEKLQDVAGSLRSISRMVRVDIDKLDTLMNIVGELVIAKGTISDISERLSGEGNEMGVDLLKATRILERRLNELQKGVMEVRMVPISQLFDKMGRIVRKVASEIGKKVALEVRGADTELDKLIIEDLADPLMHIIRNSIDHGIELPADRKASGKPEKGRILLSAAQRGNHVVIRIEDDGRGIDPEKIRRKAAEKGLIAADAAMDRQEIFDLLFMPGFSTADQVSELSGRGVGMDVVKSNISSLSGMIEIESEVGQGTTLAITLPITLAIIKALIIQVCGREYAVPINSVMETLMVDHSSIRTIEGREVIELRQSTLPLVRLSRLFGHACAPVPDRSFFVVVVGMADKRMGIVVDELLGQQDVVIKPLGNILSFVRGFAGAADLGNRKTILVLDVGGLMSESLRGETITYV